MEEALLFVEFPIVCHSSSPVCHFER